MAATRKFVTRKACAVALGISRQRVEQLIKRGDIKETADGIDLVAARRRHARLKQLDKAGGLKAAPPKARKTKAPVAVVVTRPDPDDGPDGNVLDFAGARAKRENWNAALAEANYKKLIGALVSREEVAAKEFAVARKLRDRIIGFPSRLSNFLPPEAMRIVTEECTQLCRELLEDAATIAESGAAA